MDAELKLGKDVVKRDVELGTVTNTEERDPVSFFKNFSKMALFDTGLLPLAGTGVLAIRQALDHTQIVFQHSPGMYYVNWGAYERDVKAKTYYLAQPWRIVIGDMKDGELLGARTFYSPYPVQTLDQQMYHVNLPNLNCKGYSGNAVGWLCLYLRNQWGDIPFGEKVRKIVERASGVETYNDANMSQTDGPRFYQDRGKPEYVWNPEAWQSKSESDGFEWTLDEDLWIPVLVEGRDSQSQHKDNGVPLTLEMAMYGNYQAYYSDSYLPKPINSFARQDLKDPESSKIFAHAQTAFANSTAPGVVAPQPTISTSQNLGYTAPQAAPQPVLPKCVCCNDVLPEGVEPTETPEGDTCEACMKVCYGTCAECGSTKHYEILGVWTEPTNEEDPSADGVFYCADCKTIYTCKNCVNKSMNVDNLIQGGAFCTSCSTAEKCQLCNGTFAVQNIKDVDAKLAPTDESSSSLRVCQACVETHHLCACGVIKKATETDYLDGNTVCAPCVDYKDDGMPFYKPVSVQVNI